MAYCTKCGSFVKDGARFCGSCGARMENPAPPPHQASGNSRKTTYDGEIHKCPSCGAVIASFVKNCPECGYELRGVGGVESIRDFARNYANAKTNSQKIDLIRTFAIPNTKEDIVEFAILASSNIDTESYTRGNVVMTNGVSQLDVSEAWMAKFEQAYQKARIVLAGTPELEKIEKLYEDKKEKLSISQKNGKKALRQNNKKVIFILAGILCAILFFAASIAIPVRSGEKKLEKQVEQIEIYIADGNYDAALTTAYAMSTSYSESWTQTRESLIERIKKLQGEAKGLVSVPVSADDVKEKNYADVVLQFQKAGFLNVVPEKVPDLITGWLHGEGEVIGVSIDGNTSFTKGDYYEPNVSVIVRYHGYSDEKEK